MDTLPNKMKWLVIHGLYLTEKDKPNIEENTSFLITCYGDTGSIMSRIDGTDGDYHEILVRIQTVRNC